MAAFEAGAPGGVSIKLVFTGLCYGAAACLNLYWVIMGDRLFLWTQVAIVPVTVLVAGAGLFAHTRGLRHHERRRSIRRGLLLLLAYYLCILSVLLFFGGLFHVDRGYDAAINLEPLDTIWRYIHYYQRTGSFVSIANLVGNMVVLVPMGVLLPVLFRCMRRFWIFLPFAALVAVGVEALQWLTGTGVADVDDSILNFAGSALGYWATRLVQIAFAMKRRKSR